MKRFSSFLMLSFAFVLIVAGGRIITAQDKYAVQVPDGLSFSEVRGYESWELVAVARPDQLLNAIVANSLMIEAYKAGIPDNGKPFPDGSKIVKIRWLSKSVESPIPAQVTDRLYDVGVMVKDSKRFAASGGWGYAMFKYDAASGRFTGSGSGTQCGAACHMAAKPRDFVFTEYGKR